MGKNLIQNKEFLDVPKHSSSSDIPQFTEEGVDVFGGISQNSDFLKRKGKKRCISGGGKTSLRQSHGKSKSEDPSLSNLQNVLKKHRKDCKISKLTSNGEKSCYLNDDDATGDLHESNYSNNIQETSSGVISCGKFIIDKCVGSTGNDQLHDFVIPKQPCGVSQSFEPIIPITIVEDLSSSNHKDNSNAHINMLSSDSVTTTIVATLKTLNQLKENGSNSDRREVLLELVQQNLKEHPKCTKSTRSTSLQKQAIRFSINSKHSLPHDTSRVLRPRSQNPKNRIRKRRHFYEIYASDIDPFWILMRNIKVFWPLDDIWYFGVVKDYNASIGLHHVQYDDDEEEWIDLKNERFKLLMFPNEFVCKDFKKLDHEVQEETEKVEDAIVGDCLSSMKDSEPLISWLGSSFDQVKPSAKEKKKSYSSKKFSLHFAQRKDHTVACSSGINSDKDGDAGFIASHMVVNDLSHLPVFKNEEGTIDKRYSLFYFRRHFHKRRKITGKYGFEGDITSNTLKLNQRTPVVMLPLKYTHNLTFSSESSWLSNFWWSYFGKLMSTWPEIYLEIVFLDNVKGLKIISFEGCLRKAVVIFCLILKIFEHSNACWMHIHDQCPFTTIGFRFSVIQDIGRQLHFAAHYFLELESSKWGYLHQYFKNRCFLVQDVPVSKCTHSNTKNLLERKFMVPLLEVLDHHLNFLMCQNKNASSSNELQDTHGKMIITDGCVHADSSSCQEEISSEDKFDERSHSFVDTINYQKQRHGQVESQQLDVEVKETIATDTPMKLNDSIVHGMFPTLRSGHHDMHNMILTTFGFNSQAFSNNIGFVNGSRKKPSTQSLRQKKRRPCKKTKTNIAKNFKSFSKKNQKNFSQICEANVLVIEGDIGWREHAAEVLLDFDDQAWKLLINVSGIPKYSHKVCQFLQPGTTNLHTHAMKWKGGRNWTLEFTDHDQWALFKALHQECYNLNIRASDLKIIPIPGVRLIEENNDYDFAVPFKHNSSTYISQTGTEIDVAMDPSRAIYDMDSDDDEWVSKQGNSMNESADDKMRNISCEMFENAIDILEKYAYAKKCDEFSYDEIMCFMEDIGPPEVIKSIQEYWLSKRQKKGMALIRQFQPPLWEQYQKQLQEWKRVNANSYNPRKKGTLIEERPSIFAFCLKPPNNGSNQRPHKKFTGSGSHSMILREKRNLQGTGRASLDLDHESSNSSHSVESSLAPTRCFPIDDVSFTEKFSVSNSWLDKSKVERGNNKRKRLMYEQNVKRSNIAKKKCGCPKWLNTEKNEPALRRHLADIEESRCRELSDAAQHASNMAMLKREKVKWLTRKSDLAVNRAAIVLRMAEVMKASRPT